jgi:glycerol uptake facilitator-like aquaporin
MKNERWTIGLAVFFIITSALTLFVWIPIDIETGVVETFRRRVNIGDAMAPTVVAAAILVVSILMGVMALIRPSPNLMVKEGLDKQSFNFLSRMIIPLGLGLSLMLYAGPLVVDFINTMGGEISTYRQLKDTFPYKFIGYSLGGFVLVFGLVCLIENRSSLSAAWAAIIAVLLLTLLYEVPFDNLLLPPNGDY